MELLRLDFLFFSKLKRGVVRGCARSGRAPQLSKARAPGVYVLSHINHTSDHGPLYLIRGSQCLKHR